MKSGRYTLIGEDWEEYVPLCGMTLFETRSPSSFFYPDSVNVY